MQVAVRWRSKHDPALGHFAFFATRPVEVDDDFRIGARQLLQNPVNEPDKISENDSNDEKKLQKYQ